MRPFSGAPLRASCALTLVPLVASAQAFTGTIELRIAKDSLAPQVYTVATKGEQWHGFLRDDSPQPVIFMMLLDGRTRALREAGYVRGGVTAESVADPLNLPAPAMIELTPVGKQRKIQGHACEDFTFVAAGRPLTGCFATTLGRFFAPPPLRPLPVSGGGDAPVALPEWLIALSEQERFPLKVWDAKGKTLMEVESVKAGMLPDCFFRLLSSIRPNPSGPIVDRQIVGANQRAALDGAFSAILFPAGCALIKDTGAGK